MEWNNDYLYVQENGQMKYGGPPPDWKGPAPPKGTEIFVYKLPREARLSEICPIFAQIGSLYAARLMMDFSGTNRGFCFIQYATRMEAKKAISTLNEFEIRRGVKIRVTKSLDNCRLFIGQVPKDLTREDIKETLEQITSGVKEVILYLSPTDKSYNRGFCFVEYYDHRSAAMARRNLIAAGGIPKWGRDLRIDWAIPEEEVDEDVMSQVTVLYIRNLMLRTTESSLKEVICKFISPYNFTRLRKVKDFAFVHFRSREAAEIVMNHVNGFILDGAELVATWAKPSPCDDEVRSKNEEGIAPKKEKEKKRFDGKKKKTKPCINKRDATKLFEDTQEPPVESPIYPLTYSPISESVLLPYSPHTIPSPVNNMVVPLIYSGNVELTTETLQEIITMYLTSFQPAVALQYIMMRLGFGDVYYKMKHGLDQHSCTTFSAEVLVIRQDNMVYNPPLFHPPTYSPLDAKNLAALVFINVYLIGKHSLYRKC